MSDNFFSFAEQVGKDIARMQPLIEPELRSLDHTMTGTGGSTPNAWVSLSPAPSGWVTYNTVPTGEYIFMLSTDSPDADFTLKFRSGGSSSSEVLTRTGNCSNPVTVRVSNPGVGSYSVQHHSSDAVLTMRVIKVGNSSASQAGDIDTGWRDVSDTLSTSWTIAPGGHIRLRRLDEFVYLSVKGLSSVSGAVGNLTELPVGFRPIENGVTVTWPNDGTQPGRYSTASTWFVRIWNITGGDVTDPNITNVLSFPAAPTHPTSLPGIPV